MTASPFQIFSDATALDLTDLILHGVKLKNRGRMIRRPLLVRRVSYTLLIPITKILAIRKRITSFLTTRFSVHYAIGKSIL